MAVKDLVERYETPTRRPNASVQASSRSTATLATLAPTPARFLPHREVRVNAEASSSSSTSTTLASDPPSKFNETDIAELDDHLSPPDDAYPRFLNHNFKRPSAIQFAEDDEREKLIPHSYPPVQKRPRIVSVNTATTWSSTRSHIPIPATTVFARNAAPLYLPRLDNYLSVLPKPRFLEGLEGKDGSPAMFPPMERLIKSGMSLDDMEANAVRIPIWRDRKTLLGATINLVIGFLVRFCIDERESG